uniref:Uncharacterized protein n=1 Tax=Ignisphaera aggregans TaxID=334771 RepID=A0A7J3JT44_9CREN
MNISNSMLQYVNNLYKEVDERVDRAVREEASKEYIQVLSELMSLVSSLRKFLSNASMLNSAYMNVKSGRICFQWFYTEDHNHISLVRFEPRVTIAYNGAGMHVSFNDKSISLYSNAIEYHINSLKEVLSLNEVDSIIARKSLLLDILGTLKTILQHYMDDFIKCSRTFKSR